MIYDCFTFFNELELLELRMSVMGDAVDYFVLVESTRTFTGKPKELFYENNKDKFDNSKIIHVIVNDSPIDKPTSIHSEAKQNEAYQRECMRKGLVDADDDSIIIISDVDEIVNMDTVIKNLPLLKRKPYFSLDQKLFYYYVNFYLKFWPGPVVCKYKNVKSFERFRNKRFRRRCPDGGWHYSYLGGVESIKTKISSYAMTTLDIPRYTSYENIENSLKTGKDLFGRRKDCSIVDLDGNSHKYMKDFVEKYPYFLKEQ